MFGSGVFAHMLFIVNTHDAEGNQMWFVALQKWMNYTTSTISKLAKKNTMGIVLFPWNQPQQQVYRYT